MYEARTTEPCDSITEQRKFEHVYNRINSALGRLEEKSNLIGKAFEPVISVVEETGVCKDECENMPVLRSAFEEFMFHIERRINEVSEQIQYYCDRTTV